MNLSSFLGVPDPSQNVMDQTSNLLGRQEFSPVQEWERYVRTPDHPTIIINFSLSEMLKGLLDILLEPEVAKPLSKFLKGVTE